MSCAAFAAGGRQPHGAFLAIRGGMDGPLDCLLAVLVTVACYVIAKIRPKPAKKERRASQWLSKFRESHSRG